MHLRAPQRMREQQNHTKMKIKYQNQTDPKNKPIYRWTKDMRKEPTNQRKKENMHSSIAPGLAANEKNSFIILAQSCQQGFDLNRLNFRPLRECISITCSCISYWSYGEPMPGFRYWSEPYAQGKSPLAIKTITHIPRGIRQQLKGYFIKTVSN